MKHSLSKLIEEVRIEKNRLDSLPTDTIGEYDTDLLWYALEKLLVASRYLVSHIESRKPMNKVIVRLIEAVMRL